MWQKKQTIFPGGTVEKITIWLFNSLPWKDPPLLRTVNHLFLWSIYTMAMLVITRGYVMVCHNTSHMEEIGSLGPNGCPKCSLASDQLRLRLSPGPIWPNLRYPAKDYRSPAAVPKCPIFAGEYPNVSSFLVVDIPIPVKLYTQGFPTPFYIHVSVHVNIPCLFVTVPKASQCFSYTGILTVIIIFLIEQTCWGGLPPFSDTPRGTVFKTLCRPMPVG